MLESKKYTGQYGIVLIPDLEIRAEVEKLARAVKGNEIPICGQLQVNGNISNFPPDRALAHHTLFYTQLKDAPNAFVEELVADLASVTTRGLTLEYTHTNVFADHFGFWHAKLSDRLYSMHVLSLALARYHNPLALQQSDREGLILPRDMEDNKRRFGHPLVLNYYQPHITFAFVRDSSRIVPELHEFGGYIKYVAFVEIKEYGMIKRVVFKKEPV